jgi:aminocarboxymuconate-semialdehyde decarboxylase
MATPLADLAVAEEILNRRPKFKSERANIQRHVPGPPAGRHCPGGVATLARPIGVAEAPGACVRSPGMSDYVHTCRPTRGARAAPLGASQGGRLTIDMHCHLLNPRVEALVAGAPVKMQEGAAQAINSGAASAAQNQRLMASVYRTKLVDISERLADMDAMGVDIQAISPSPTQYYYWAERDLSEAVVRELNENVAEVCARNPDRFVGLGSVSLQDPILAAEQAEDAVRRLGLKGVEISTLVNGVDIGDPRFEPFWARMESIGAVAFIHPLGTSLGKRLDRFYLSNIVGQPAETAIALSQLIFSGVFDRFPGLKVCAAHGGGYFPLYASRADHGYEVRPEACSCAHPPSAYLKQIWYDTVVYDPDHLRRLIEVVGASQIVIGTDYPFDMGDYDPHGLIDAIAGLTDADRAALLGGNAARLLGFDDAARATAGKIGGAR